MYFTIKISIKNANMPFSCVEGIRCYVNTLYPEPSAFSHCLRCFVESLGQRSSRFLGLWLCFSNFHNLTVRLGYIFISCVGYLMVFVIWLGWPRKVYLATYGTRGNPGRWGCCGLAEWWKAQRLQLFVARFSPVIWDKRERYTLED